MNRDPVDTSQIPGWGVDADPANNPTYPMRNIAEDDKAGMSWERPTQQNPTVKILCSNEHLALPAVFGTPNPPSGLSGLIRGFAFKFSESKWNHWLLLLMADRINMIEGIINDLVHLRIPNIPAEMGLRSELKHNLGGFLLKLAIAIIILAALFYWAD